MADLPSKARLELRRVYAKVQADLAKHPGLYCELSGRCCRFEEAGHELFLTELEFREMRSWGGTPPPNPAACPWQKDGLCSNQKGRALACRTYFCSDEDEAAEVFEHWHRQIRRIHERHGLAYEYRTLYEHMNPPAPIASKEES